MLKVVNQLMYDQTTIEQSIQTAHLVMNMYDLPVVIPADHTAVVAPTAGIVNEESVCFKPNFRNCHVQCDSGKELRIVE